MAGKRAARGVFVLVGGGAQQQQRCGLNIKPDPLNDTKASPCVAVYSSMHTRAGFLCMRMFACGVCVDGMTVCGRFEHAFKCTCVCCRGWWRQ